MLQPRRRQRCWGLSSGFCLRRATTRLTVPDERGVAVKVTARVDGVDPEVGGHGVAELDRWGAHGKRAVHPSLSVSGDSVAVCARSRLAKQRAGVAVISAALKDGDDVMQKNRYSLDQLADLGRVVGGGIQDSACECVLVDTVANRLVGCGRESVVRHELPIFGRTIDPTLSRARLRRTGGRGDVVVVCRETGKVVRRGNASISNVSGTQNIVTLTSARCRR